jgi:NAD(P)-dependent dehydrogenase (short-subunit alcohol dehydrogenase family)
MVARGAERLRAEAKGLHDATGARIEAVAADVLKEEDISRVAAETQDKFSHANILVNNAYVFGDTAKTDILDIPSREWEATFLGNVLAPYGLCRALGKGMRAGIGGSIINILSGAAFQPAPGVSPYGSTKAALWTMTRYLARELAPKIRVNAICPGIIGRDLSDLSSIPMGRVGGADEVAPAALYLASSAASYTTGTIVFVNGGRAW